MLLFQHSVGLVPLTHVDVDVPAHIEVVGLDVAVVVVTQIHSRDNFFEEEVRITIKVVLKPVLVDVDTEFFGRLTVLLVSHIGEEVDFTFFDVQHQNRMVANCEGGFDAVLLADLLDTGSEFCFHILGNVCHFDNSC